MSERLDQPLEQSSRLRRRWFARTDSDATGRISEAIARFTGTPRFLIWLTVFVTIWIGWNTWGPESMRFDSAALGYTALTLMLSLQASYAAPLILLAQNRQDDRDRVIAEQDRRRAERNLADTEYLTREIASLRMALNDVATRDFVRSELRDLVEELTREHAERLAEREDRIQELTEELEQLRRDREEREDAREREREEREREEREREDHEREEREREDHEREEREREIHAAAVRGDDDPLAHPVTDPDQRAQ